MATPKRKPRQRRWGVELAQEDIDQVWHGFRRYLRRRGFPAHVIESSAEDLFAGALLDFVELVDGGTTDIYFPRGLLFHCAWCRARKLAARHARQPPSVGLDAVSGLASCEALPDEVVCRQEQQQGVRAAIAILGPREREMARLMYSEGRSCRAAGRSLGWGKSQAQRKHDQVRRQLRPLFEKNGIGCDRS